MSSPTSHHDDALVSHRELTILYATETGNAQDVAERLARHARRLHFSVRVFSIDDYSVVRSIGTYNVYLPHAITLDILGGHYIRDSCSLRDRYRRLRQGTAFYDSFLDYALASRSTRRPVRPP